LRHLLPQHDQNFIPVLFVVSSIHPVTNLTVAGSFTIDDEVACLSGHDEQGGHS
jgi:hypothetical protein